MALAIDNVGPRALGIRDNRVPFLHEWRKPKRRLVCLCAVTLLLQGAGSMVAGAQTTVSGTIQCGKTDPQNRIEVGDRLNHVLMIGKIPD
jgi:hypothetical protein